MLRPPPFEVSSHTPLEAPQHGGNPISGEQDRSWPVQSFVRAADAAPSMARPLGQAGGWATPWGGRAHADLGHGQDPQGAGLARCGAGQVGAEAAWLGRRQDGGGAGGPAEGRRQRADRIVGAGRATRIAAGAGGEEGRLRQGAGGGPGGEAAPGSAGSAGPPGSAGSARSARWQAGRGG